MRNTSSTRLARLRSMWDLRPMLEPDDRLRQHLYTAAGAGAGIVNIVVNIVAAGTPRLADLGVMLLGMVLLT